MQKLQIGNLDGLAGLAGLADHTGLDIRPTLLRVLTDLYLQKPSHSVEEERHYVELALRLIEVVDAGTCAAVAARLSPYPGAPPEVVQRLAPIAALGYPRPSAILQTATTADGNPGSDDFDIFEPNTFDSELVIRDAANGSARQQLLRLHWPPREPADFVELRETFFDADAPTRRLILMNLDVVAMPDSPALASGTNIMRYLEQAALAGRRQEFTTLLQQSLGISRALATRIVADASGEPFAVAGRALEMPSGVFQRILMFLNPEIGRSVQRVYDLADLFLDLPQDSALHLVRVWRAGRPHRSAGRPPSHGPLAGKREKPAVATPQERQRGADIQVTIATTQRRA